MAFILNEVEENVENLAAVIVLGNLGFHLTASMPSGAVIALLVWFSLPAAFLLFVGSYFLSCRIFENMNI
jgi:hypothetical protein